jgi:hypothetical protein
MSSSGKLKLKWNDEYLTWNKSHFNYIDRLLVAADNIWKPDIRVTDNGLEKFFDGLTCVSYLCNRDFFK